MLLVVTLCEVLINRVAVPMLRPGKGVPPAWHTALDYLGLFSFYFVSALAAFIIVHHAVLALRRARLDRATAAHAIAAITAVITLAPLVVGSSPTFGLVVEVAFAVGMLALLIANLRFTAPTFGGAAARGGAASPRRERDLGIAIGLPLFVLPLLIHSLTVVGGLVAWSADPFDGPTRMLARAGLTTTCIAALITPYSFAPRPFARAVTRALPLVTAICVASITAVASRFWYPALAKIAKLTFGIELHTGRPDPQLALYLLALATLTWTVVSCAIANAASRRTVGCALALIVLGGYAFHWPHHFLLPLLGMVLLVEAGGRVRDEELAAMPIETDAPPVDDATWASYIGLVTQGLRRTLTDVHSLTTRGEGGLASSVIVGEASGLAVRVRIERIAGAAIALDVVLGAAVDELRGATLCLWAVPARDHGAAPPGPPAAPAFKTGDAELDARFIARGSSLAFARLFDEDLRARMLAALDGWLAYWDRESVRYRVYPGRGAPLDHPLPLADLAMGRVPANADRLLAVIELLVAIGQRAALPVASASPEPTELGA